MNSELISEFKAGDNTIYHIDHPKFRASISKFGGHVLSFAPQGAQDLLWLSKTAKLDGSKAIRGGIPLCWPWFGPATGKNEGQPQHGYARSTFWNFELLEETDSKMVIKLQPEFSDDLALDFDLTAFVTLSDTLKVELHSTNKTSDHQELSQAIHSYFSIANIDETELGGLENTEYVCKVTNQTVSQESLVKLTEHSDRVYNTANSPILIDDQQRQIKVGGNNHDSVVVWNPWAQNAAGMGDFDDLGYQQMVCVEMANTQDLNLAAGETYVMSQTIGLAD